ncbi:HTH domain-containing protein [Natrinema sp. HArc-T2]|uniref:HTH domain-containing protein n=1 Tax=Natrinema sp. HArc-T2 TaxID=3242701 RepID=UPI00359D0C89
MSANELLSPAVTAAPVDRQLELRVECYVRASVPAALTETIDDIVDRLHSLRESGTIADYQVTTWPPECQPIDSITEGEPTRDELVAEFERWAAQHDCSLEPAFQRQNVPLLEAATDDSIERVRVPVVALALYADDAGADTDSLCGVVPYTNGERTHTVTEWLMSTEPNEGTDGTPMTGNEQSTPLETGTESQPDNSPSDR